MENEFDKKIEAFKRFLSAIEDYYKNYDETFGSMVRDFKKICSVQSIQDRSLVLLLPVLFQMYKDFEYLRRKANKEKNKEQSSIAKQLRDRVSEIHDKIHKSVKPTSEKTLYNNCFGWPPEMEKGRKPTKEEEELWDKLLEKL